MARLMAFLVLLIPGIIAGYGIKLMRDTFYGIGPIDISWLQFLIGFVLMVAGVGFIAGFVLYRDRKKGKIPVKKDNPKSLK